MEQETSILRYTELTAILHSTSKKELTKLAELVQYCLKFSKWNSMSFP
jgi:hypothetical protein